MEQTLFICRSVDVFGPIPSRTGRGHISGEWLIENKIATTRCRVVAIGNELEVRLEDLDRYIFQRLFTEGGHVQDLIVAFCSLYSRQQYQLSYVILLFAIFRSGEIFGACPVPLGHREAAVEGAADSSRNFVLRIVDPATKRHAYLGINFAERSNAFDFNVSLTDFEKRIMREDELRKAAASGGASTQTASTSSGGALPEAAILYQKHDYSLKEGEHIRVEVKKPVGSSAGGFLSRLGATGTSSSANNNNNTNQPKLAPLAPPPGINIPTTAAPLQSSGGSGAFGATSFEQTTTAAVTPVHPQTDATSPQLASKVVASTEEGWATF